MRISIPILPASITGNASRTLTTQSTLSSNQQLQSSIQTLLSNARYLCVTMIAYMLRYATFIQPPASATATGGSAKSTNSAGKEEPQHIVTSLLSLYKESLKPSEVRIRRRIIAALGEISFYISAQEEDTQQQDGKTGNALDKWTFPNAIVDVMLKCLRDDSDEIVKHYAAKASHFFVEILIKFLFVSCYRLLKIYYLKVDYRIESDLSRMKLPSHYWM